jgi:hypothetical protein
MSKMPVPTGLESYKVHQNRAVSLADTTLTVIATTETKTKSVKQLPAETKTMPLRQFVSKTIHLLL